MTARFFRAAGWIAVAEMGARLKSIVVMPLLTRHLGPGDFGVMSQVGMMAMTLMPLVSLGTESGMFRMLPGDSDERRAARFSAWLLFLLAGTTALAMLLWGMRGPIGPLFLGHSESMNLALLLGVVNLAASLLLNAARTWYRIGGEGRVLSVLTLAQAAGNAAAVVGGVAAGWDVFAFIGVTAVADGVIALIFITMIFRKIGLRIPDFSIIWPALRFGLPLVPAGYAMWGLNWMDRLFLVKYQSMEAIGVYSAAYGLGYMVVQVFANPIWTMYPTAVTELHNRGDHGGVNELLNTTMAVMLGISLPAITLLWAIDDAVIALIAGPSFSAGALVMPIAALGYLLSLLSSFADVALGLAFRQVISTVSIAIALAVNFVLNVVLIPIWGIEGAAWATLGAFAVQLMVSGAAARMVGALRIDGARLVKIVLAAIISGLCVRVTTAILGPPVWGALLVAVLGGCLYVGLIWFGGAIPESMAIDMRSKLRKRMARG